MQHNKIKQIFEKRRNIHFKITLLLKYQPGQKWKPLSRVVVEEIPE
jgi:hypothetical protein